MHIVDIAIIGILILAAIMGVRNGFTRQLVRTLGLILVLFLAFNFKDVLSELMYRNLPFFSYFGLIKGIEIFNILIYEMLAFLIIIFGLFILLRLLLMAANVFEIIMNFTLVFGFFSKILGAFVGIIQYFFLIFIALYILTLPVFNNDWLENSKFSDKILTKTPYLSNWTGDSYAVLREFKLLKDEYQDDQNKFSLEALDVFLKYNVISIESARYLVESGKIELDQVETVLRKYDEKGW